MLETNTLSFNDDNILLTESINTSLSNDGNREDHAASIFRVNWPLCYLSTWCLVSLNC